MAAAGHTITPAAESHIRRMIQPIINEYARLPAPNAGDLRDTYEAYLGFFTKFYPIMIRPASPKSRSLGSASNITRSFGRSVVRSLTRLVDKPGSSWHSMADTWHVGESVLRKLELRIRCGHNTATAQYYRRGIVILKRLYDSFFETVESILRNPEFRHENITRPEMLFEALAYNLKDEARHALREMIKLLGDIDAIKYKPKKSCTIMGGFRRTRRSRNQEPA